MEYGALRICVMIFCEDHLFLGIGAADGRAITVAAFNHLPGTDALNPCYVVGCLRSDARSISPSYGPVAQSIRS